MNSNTRSLPAGLRRAEEFRKTVKALFIVAAILAVLGCLALVVGAGWFTMKSPATPLVDILGEICFWGCLPVLFLAGLSGVGGMLSWWLSHRIQPIDEAEDEEEVC
jgi:hypothetical protein